MTAAERRAVISGIGQSQVGRRLGRDGLDLTIDAARNTLSQWPRRLPRRRGINPSRAARRRGGLADIRSSRTSSTARATTRSACTSNPTLETFTLVCGPEV